MGKKTLHELIRIPGELYRQRNELYLSCISKKIGFLNIGIRALEDDIREKRSALYDKRCAQVFARWAGLVLHFSELPIIEGLAQKYPLRCSYCNRMPCSCTEEARAESRLATKLNEEQLSWSLQEWQTHLNHMYGEKNRDRGIYAACSSLFSESGELTFLWEIHTTSHLNGNELRKEYCLELTDVFARLVAVANLIGVDLEKAVLDLYENGCPKCKRTVNCGCGQMYMTLRKLGTITIKEDPGSAESTIQ